MSRREQQAAALLESTFKLGDELLVKRDVSRQQNDRVTGKHFRRGTRELHIEHLPVGGRPQVAQLRIAWERVRVNMIASRKQLMVEQVPELPVPRGRLQDSPRLVHVAVVARQVIQHDGDRGKWYAAIVRPHELKYFRRLLSVRRQPPGGFSFLEECGDTILRRDHGYAGKPGMQPHPLVKAERMAGIQAPGIVTLFAQWAAAGAGAVKPWTDLHRPRLLPLPRRTARESELRLRKGDVLTHLQANASRPPFSRIGFIV